MINVSQPSFINWVLDRGDDNRYDALTGTRIETDEDGLSISTVLFGGRVRRFDVSNKKYDYSGVRFYHPDSTSHRHFLSEKGHEKSLLGCGILLLNDYLEEPSLLHRIFGARPKRFDPQSGRYYQDLRTAVGEHPWGVYLFGGLVMGFDRRAQKSVYL